MKQCSSCKQHKKKSQFHKKSASADGLQSRCVDCSIRKRLQYYESHKKDQQQYNRTRRQRVKDQVINFLEQNPCIDCGEQDVVVLEFDHQKDKHDNVSNMIKRGCGWTKIKREIDKCEVRCANCHRRKTAKELGWYNGPLI